MTVEFPYTGRFQFGRVVARTTATIKANFGTFLALGLVLSFLPNAGLELLRHTLGLTSSASENAITIPINLIGIVLSGGLISGALKHLHGKAITFAGCLNDGLGNFGGLFVVGLLTGLGIVGGLILLVVPGLIWAAAWSVAGPAWVSDRGSYTAAIGRSLKLTRGHRWPIFGLILVTIVCFFSVSMVLSILTTVAVQLLPGNVSADSLLDLLVMPLMVMILMIALGAGGAVIYDELPGTKTVTAAESVAATFD